MSTPDELIATKYPDVDIQEHVLTKDMWAGTRSKVTNTEYVVDCKGGQWTGRWADVSYAPAWLKTIDEPIVNAADHYVRSYSSATPMITLDVRFNRDGSVRVYNDGPGVDVAVHPKAGLWIPNFVFGCMFKGSNIKKDAADPIESIVGGQHGVGSKLSNILSTEFVVETFDGRRGLYYQMKWRDHMRDPERPQDARPTIIKAEPGCGLSATAMTPHTTLFFRPDYVGVFEYPAPADGGFVLSDEEYSTLSSVVRARVLWAAAYLHYTNALWGGRNRPRVTYNGEPVPDLSATQSTPTIARLAAILHGSGVIPTRLYASPESTPFTQMYGATWEIAAVVGKNSGTCTNVNGIVVPEGKHVSYVTKKIVKLIADEIPKVLGDKTVKVSEALVMSKVSLLMNTQIPNPGWTGQRKDVLDINVKRFARYSFDSKWIREVAKAVSVLIGTDVQATPQKVKSVEYDKCREAKYAGKRSKKCMLLFAEGDSAMAQVVNGVSRNKALGFDYYGVMSTAGVPINPIRECQILDGPRGARIVRPSDKFTGNLFINAFMQELGLSLTATYDPESPTYDAEIRRLRYGAAIACVDQDVDGVGNIFGLILSLFFHIWPNLIRQGFVKRFDTPRIRAYPKAGGKVLSFYAQHEYDAWVAQVDTNRYNIQYYKGLSTHSEEETIHMFGAFHDHLITYTLDEASARMFHIYFGKDSDERKAELSKPLVPPSPERLKRQYETLQVSCSDHLYDETGSYQRDNLGRKLDSAIDGLNESARKIQDGSIKELSTATRIKVAQLAGAIALKENYHHGEVGLAKSVAGKAFITIGGKQLPVLLPESNFGSRLCGGYDAGSPRYIFTSLNKRLVSVLFPPCDYWLLDFTFDEGVRGEPRYFVPIIPTAITESSSLPAHGWKQEVWGRDVSNVIRNVRTLIYTSDDQSIPEMPPNKYGWRGQIRSVRGDPWAFGVYEFEANDSWETVTITELPLRTWTNDYVLWLKKLAATSPYIVSIDNRSDSIDVNIRVRMRPGTWDALEAYDDSPFADRIEEYLQLRTRMCSHLNFMGSQGEVISFKRYADVMRYWFPFRKRLYAERIERETTLLEIKLTQFENILRYIRECNDMQMSRRRASEMDSVLEARGYPRLNLGLLNSPGFTPNSQLRDALTTGPDCDYRYLLRISDADKSAESVVKWEEKLNAARDELIQFTKRANQGRFPGAQLWLDELDQLEAVITEGRRTNWQFKKFGKFKLEA